MSGQALNEEHLGILQETYRALESRMEQETLRRKVLRLLRVWRSWFIFSDDYLNGLQVGIHPTCFSSWREVHLNQSLSGRLFSATEHRHFSAWLGA